MADPFIFRWNISRCVVGVTTPFLTYFSFYTPTTYVDHTAAACCGYIHIMNLLQENTHTHTERSTPITAKKTQLYSQYHSHRQPSSLVFFGGLDSSALPPICGGQLTQSIVLEPPVRVFDDVLPAEHLEALKECCRSCFQVSYWHWRMMCGNVWVSMTAFEARKKALQESSVVFYSITGGHALAAHAILIKTWNRHPSATLGTDEAKPSQGRCLPAVPVVPFFYLFV